jgi:hypothetical protein
MRVLVNKCHLRSLLPIAALFFWEGFSPILAQGGTVPAITLPTKTIIIYKPDIGFQNMKMASFKTISDPGYKRIGIVLGDTLLFKAVLTPDVALSYEKFVWSGAKDGVGQMISTNFTYIGANNESVTVGGRTKTAVTTVVALPLTGENYWCISNPVSCLTVSADASEAQAWADSNKVSLGGGITNGRADAARHSYWNALMVVDGLTPATAIEASTAHEYSNYNEGGAHNEIVMDLENNRTGASVGLSLGVGATRTAVDSSIRAGLDSGIFAILDDIENASEIGLLQPSNK